MKLNKKQKQILELAILAFIALASFLLWDTIIVFPIKLFVVLMHEISHGIAAIFTGGKIIALDIGLNLGGKCETIDGNAFTIASAGYLGSFIFGSALFYSAYNKNNGLVIVSFISMIILLFAVNVINDFTVSIISIMAAVFLFSIKKFSPKIISDYFLKSLGLISCLYVLMDIKEDTLSGGLNYSDASVVAELTGIPELVWGLTWLIISLLGIFYMLRLGFRKGIK